MGNWPFICLPQNDYAVASTLRSREPREEKVALNPVGYFLYVVLVGAGGLLIGCVDLAVDDGRLRRRQLGKILLSELC